MTHRAQYLFLKKKNIFLKKYMRIRNEPKFLIKTPDTKWEKNMCRKIFFSKHFRRKSCMHWHEYGIIIKQVKTNNHCHILNPLQICSSCPQEKNSYMSIQNKGCNRTLKKWWIKSENKRNKTFPQIQKFWKMMS